MKKIICVSILILVLVIAGAILYSHFTAPDLELLSEQNSGLHDFYIEDGKVYVVGGVSVKNNSDEKMIYSLVGWADADYKSGLIKGPVLNGFDENLEASVFEIEAKETKTFNVVFVGEHGGNMQKANRLMPEITILY